MFSPLTWRQAIASLDLPGAEKREIHTNRDEEAPKKPVKSADKKVGRNELCPCSLTPPRRKVVRMRAASIALGVLLAAGWPSLTAAGGGDARFEDVARAFFTAGFAAQPSTATASGVHDYDSRLDDVSASAYAAQFKRDGATLAELERIDPHTLSAETAIDRSMLLADVEDDLLLSGDLAQWKHNPDSYVGIASGAIYTLVARNFAPASTRLRDVVARERQIPRLLEQAEANLTTVDAATKGVALEDAQGAAGFLAHDVPLTFAGGAGAAAQLELRRASDTAAGAMRRYAAFVSATRPRGTFAIGKVAYEKRLRYEDGLDIGLERYVSVGMNALAATRREFIATAKEIDATKSPADVYLGLSKAHPPASRLIAAGRADLIGLRAFLIAHRIVTVPPDADVTVTETPPFQRAFLFAQLDAPGPLERVATKAYYDITPPDQAWPRSRQDAYLSRFNDYQRPILSAHEVYPGHFVNFAVDRHLKLSLTRRMLWNNEFGEGWAHYDEQMIVDEGWGGGDPRVRLAQLQLALLRNCRYVAGVELQTAGWTLERSEKLFTDECFQSRTAAISETVRGTQDPMYGYYTLGKLMILKLRRDYQQKLGNAFTLQKFHDELLAHGDPPLPLLRPLMLGSADDGLPL